MSGPVSNKYVSLVLNTCAKLAGTKEIEEHTFYANGIKPASVVVDLGGNRGKFSQNIVNSFPCTVYAVEPTPELFTAFPRHARIRAFQYAIGDRNGPITFYLSDEEQASSTNKEVAEAFGFKEQVTVEEITLPKFLEEIGVSQIDLLKIDIEGAEFALFDSLSDDFLRGNIKQITVEFHDFLGGVYKSDLIVGVKNRLEALGFFTINASARHGSNADLLFVNKANKIPASSWVGLRLMQNVCRSLAARQMRIQRGANKEFVVL